MRWWRKLFGDARLRTLRARGYDDFTARLMADLGLAG